MESSEVLALIALLSAPLWIWLIVRLIGAILKLYSIDKSLKIIAGQSLGATTNTSNAVFPAHADTTRQPALVRDPAWIHKPSQRGDLDCKCPEGPVASGTHLCQRCGKYYA